MIKKFKYFIISDPKGLVKYKFQPLDLRPSNTEDGAWERFISRFHPEFTEEQKEMERKKCQEYGYKAIPITIEFHYDDIRCENCKSFLFGLNECYACKSLNKNA